MQISVNGGRRPEWAKDGKQVFYWEGARMTSATLTFDPAPRVLLRTSLFTGRFEDDYDVSSDGKRFLMIESDASGLSLVVVPNWRSELRRLTAAAGR